MVQMINGHRPRPQNSNLEPNAANEQCIIMHCEFAHSKQALATATI